MAEIELGCGLRMQCDRDQVWLVFPPIEGASAAINLTVHACNTIFFRRALVSFLKEHMPEVSDAAARFLEEHAFDV